MIVSFVDIGGIVDHHYLKFLLIRITKTISWVIWHWSVMIMWLYWDCHMTSCYSQSMEENVRENRRGNQNGQSRETGNIGTTRQRKTKQKYNTICVVHHYM